MSTFFLRQNELLFKQKVCFTCFLPKFCMRHLLNGLATHFLLSSALFTSTPYFCCQRCYLRDEGSKRFSLKLAFISLFPNISHQIASQWNNDNLNIDDPGIQGHVSSACKLQLSRWTHESIIPIQYFNQM